MGMRVTKAGKAAEARFDALVVEHLPAPTSTTRPAPVQDAPAIDWRAKYEAEVLHREELMRQIELVFDDALRRCGGNAMVRPVIIAMRERFRRAVG
jgi:hypothetical protein